MGCVQVLKAPAEFCQFHCQLSEFPPTSSKDISTFGSSSRSHTMQSKRNARLEVTTREVRSYSIYGGLAITKDTIEQDACDGVELQDHRGLLRTIVHHCPADDVRALDVDLRQFGSADFLFRRQYSEMSCLNAWIDQKLDDVNFKNIWKNVDFVASNMVLSQLLKIPFNADLSPMYCQGWVFGAARVNGKIYIGQIRREGLNMLAVMKEHQQPDTAMWTATTVRQSIALLLFPPSTSGAPGRNRRYESYMCYQKIEGGKTGECQPLYPSRFHSVTYTTLGDMRLLIASRIDAADNTIDQIKPYPEKYVHLVTVQADNLRNPTKQYRKYRLCRWWARNALNGVGSIRVAAYQAGSDNTLTQTTTIRVNDLPKKAKALQEASGEMGNIWTESACLNFLHGLLTFVKKQVVDDHTSAVYEFQAFADPGCSVQKRLSRIVVNRVPAALSNGHDYIPVHGSDAH